MRCPQPQRPAAAGALYCFPPPDTGAAAVGHAPKVSKLILDAVAARISHRAGSLEAVWCLISFLPLAYPVLYRSTPQRCRLGYLRMLGVM